MTATHLPTAASRGAIGRSRRAAASALLVVSLTASACSFSDGPSTDAAAPTPTTSSAPPSSTPTKSHASRPQASGSAAVPGFVPSQMLVPAMDTYTKESTGGQVFAAAWSTARASRSKQLIRSLSYANRHLRLDSADLGDGAVRLTGQGTIEDIVAATGQDAFAGTDDPASLVIYTIDVVPAPAAKLTMVRVIATVVDGAGPVTSDTETPES